MKFEGDANQFMKNNSENALKSLSQSNLSLNGTYEDVMIRLLESRRFEDANKFATNLRNRNPWSGPTYFVSAAYYESIGNLDEASRYIQEAIRIDKYNITYLNAATFISLKRNELDKARIYLNQSKSVSPDQKAISVLGNLIAKGGIESAR